MPTNTADIQTATQDFDFAAEHIVFIHDCEKQTFFRVSGIAGDLIEHATSVDADGYTNANILARFGAFKSSAYVSAIASETYYVAPRKAQTIQVKTRCLCGASRVSHRPPNW